MVLVKSNLNEGHLLKFNDNGQFLEIDEKPTSEYTKEELIRIRDDIGKEHPKLASSHEIKHAK